MLDSELFLLPDAHSIIQDRLEHAREKLVVMASGLDGFKWEEKHRCLKIVSSRSSYRPDVHQELAPEFLLARPRW